MGRQRKVSQWYTSIILTLFGVQCITSTTIKDVFTPESPLTRLPRESSYPSSSRYGSTSSNDKSLQPEESPDIRRDPQNLGKRCIRCDSGYLDRYPYDRYEDRERTYDRYDDRDRYYDRYDRDRHSNRDRDYDRYERYPDRSRYPEEDRYGERDRYGAHSERYDRYRDRYGGSPDRDPYDYRDRYDRYDKYDRNPERGSGYDNRGYDQRGYDRDSYRPWDETYRGSSGFDSSGKGYYFASGRPEYGSTSGYGSYGGGGYASGWNYGNSGGGGGGGRDDYRDKGYGSGSGGSRYNRDPYDGYRTTSYLYGRQSTTTIKPPSDNGPSNTQSSQDGSH